MDFSLCFQIVDNIKQVMVGKDQAIEFILIALLADGHVLLEDLPDPQSEMKILERFQMEDPLTRLAPVAGPEEICRMQKERAGMTVSAAVLEYITAIVQATRHHEKLKYGASPRGSMALMRAAQSMAAL